MDRDRTIDPAMYSESMLRANPLLWGSCILLGLYMPMYCVTDDQIWFGVLLYMTDFFHALSGPAFSAFRSFCVVMTC